MNAQIRRTPITSFKVGISLKGKQILKEDKTAIPAIYPLTIFGHLFGKNYAIELKQLKRITSTDTPLERYIGGASVISLSSTAWFLPKRCPNMVIGYLAEIAVLSSLRICFSFKEIPTLKEVIGVRRI